jgi:hypothetical protein
MGGQVAAGHVVVQQSQQFGVGQGGHVSCSTALRATHDA